MSATSGLGWTRAEVDDAGGVARELREEFTSLDYSSPYDEQDITGLDKMGYQRLLLKQDYKGTVNGPFDPAANSSHAVFSGDLRVIRTLGLTVAGAVLNAEVFFTEYKLNRAANGEFVFANPFALGNGVPPVWA